MRIFLIFFTVLYGLTLQAMEEISEENAPPPQQEFIATETPPPEDDIIIPIASSNELPTIAPQQQSDEDIGEVIGVACFIVVMLLPKFCI